MPGEPLASVGNKRITVRPDGLEVKNPTMLSVMSDVLVELRRIRLGLQLQTNDDLDIDDAEDK